MLSTKSARIFSLVFCLGTIMLRAQDTNAAADNATKPAGSDAAPAEKVKAPAGEKESQTAITPPETPAPPADALTKPAPPARSEPAESSPEDFRLMTGLHGGLMIPFNSIHSVGYSFGMTLDYTLYRRYGIHFGAETGVLPARAQTLSASPANITVLDGGTFGFLNLHLTGMYVFPKIWDLNPSAGFGLAYYQLTGGSYDFNASIAPVAIGSVYYDILPNLQVGVIGQFLLARTGKITTTGAEYTLKSATWLTAASLAVSLRYAWF